MQPIGREWPLPGNDVRAVAGDHVACISTFTRYAWALVRDRGDGEALNEQDAVGVREALLWLRTSLKDSSVLMNDFRMRSVMSDSMCPVARTCFRY